MREKLKKDLPMLIGLIIGFLIVDLIEKNEITLTRMIIRIVVVLAVHSVFSFIEIRRIKHKK